MERRIEEMENRDAAVFAQAMKEPRAECVGELHKMLLLLLMVRTWLLAVVVFLDQLVLGTASWLCFQALL
ncbi:hypothetical protein Ancab_004690 [Ancistrocladus abbreviatus]